MLHTIIRRLCSLYCSTLGPADIPSRPAQVYGGNFSRLMPSDLRAPGAFARNSVPVSAGDYASETQKGQLISIFKRDGCHHCGERRQGGEACVCSGGALPLQQVNAVEVVV